MQMLKNISEVYITNVVRTYK